ncbi:MAG: DUF4388 domain-containing protein [Syntrophorhabdaceae bacterium]|nr:DUF4388 domain-containing protein [Syntrophorhabdaceae bacterium]
MKKVRLDKILLKSGKLTEEVLQKALLRQKSRGGKLGTHLLYYGAFTEDELVAALSEQYLIPGIQLSGMEILQDTLDKLPASVANKLTALPFRFDKTRRELHVAIADPDRPNVLIEVQRACGGNTVVLYVAPEAIIRREIDRHYFGKSQSSGLGAVDLPELFAEQTGIPDAVAEQIEESVLLFTRQAYLKNVLPSLFEREHIRLVVADSPAGVVESVKASGCVRGLVSEECREEFEKIAAASGNAAAFPDVTYFGTVSGSMLDNPVSYGRMFECLFAALQNISAARNPVGLGPLALISGDIVEVGHILGLPRLVIDGLRIGACLLVPALPEKKSPQEPVKTIQSQFFEIDASVDVARRIAFPWDVAECLKALKSVPVAGKMAIAAGVLSIVWYRHYSLSSLRAGSSGAMEALKSRLRVLAGRLAPSSVVEAYIRVIEQRDSVAGSGQDIFIVGEGDLVPENLRNELRSHGFRVLESESLQEAAKAYLRRRPAAILLHVDSSRSAVDAFCRYIREEVSDSDTALIAITSRNEPSFLLNLMDTWFNDVLPMPIDAPVAVARISRTLSHREKGAVDGSGKGFSATFKDLSFIDLVQTLVGGGRDVRMVVDGPSGQRAEIYFREGKVVFAVAGKAEGPDAFYQVIMWQADGSFRVEPTTAFPESNIKLPTDYILLEGLRRLDEGLAER